MATTPHDRHLPHRRQPGMARGRLRSYRRARLSTWLAALVGPARTAGLAALAYAAAVGPRASYPYPLHVDEWTHLAYAEALIQHTGVPHPEPLYGQEAAGFRPEAGFRALLAALRLAIGVDWLSMFPILQGATFVLYVLIVLHLGRLLGAGPWPGILALGAPTTTRFLGPAMAVPVALALAFLAALASLLAQPSAYGRWRLPLLVGLLLLGMLLVHPPTALVASPLTLVGAGYLARQAGPGEKAWAWATAAMAAALPVAWLLALPGGVRAGLGMEAIRGIGGGEGRILEYAQAAGHLRIALFALGTFAILRWRPDPPNLSLLAGYAALLGYIRLHELGLAPVANFYDRSWLYLDLLLALVGGIGLAVLSEQASPWRRWGSRAGRLGAPVLASLVVAAVMAESWRGRVRDPGYRLATSESVEDFRWIRRHLQGVPGLTLVDPRIAVTYPAQAHRPVYASAAKPRPSPPERIRRASRLLQAPQPPLEELREEGIGVIYRPGWQEGGGVVEVRPGILVVCPAESVPSSDGLPFVCLAEPAQP